MALPGVGWSALGSAPGAGGGATAGIVPCVDRSGQLCGMVTPTMLVAVARPLFAIVDVSRRLRRAWGLGRRFAGRYRSRASMTAKMRPDTREQSGRPVPRRIGGRLAKKPESRRH